MSIVHVAKLANVSVATVSRVINNHPRVAPDTVAAVREAMRTLSYLPSDRRPGPKPAKHATRRVNDIGFFVFGTTPGRTTPTFDSLLYGVSVAAAQAGVNLSFSHLPDFDTLPARLFEKRYDGLLLHGAAPPDELRERLQAFPTVWLMGNRQRPVFGDRVMPDSYRVGELAGEYLMRRGHERLAFFNLDAGHWSLNTYGQAFVDVCQDAGKQAVVISHAEAGSSRYWKRIAGHSVDELVSRYLALPDRPTGLFVADDMQTGVLQPALQAAGVAFGEGSVEIISCNREDRYLAALHPQPVSIDIRPEAVGRRGIEHLLWRIERGTSEDRLSVLVSPELPAGGMAR